MIGRAALALVTLAALATPALAFPTCPVHRPGLTVTFGLEIGKFTEAERDAFNEQRLRAQGIDASNTTMWEGCIQAIVTTNGHIKMRFYDPETLEEVF